jgi:hypothetical protein
MNWNSLKKIGNPKYKTGGVEPIDLYKAGGFLTPFAIGCIIKYAYRNAKGRVNPKDIEKIIHYANIILAEEKERYNEKAKGKEVRKIGGTESCL